MKTYKLDEEGNIVSCTVLEWSNLVGDSKTQIGFDRLEDGSDNLYEISTTFLGIGCSIDSNLFETAVFLSGKNETCIIDELTRTSSTKSQAIKDHHEVVEEVKAIIRLSHNEAL